MKLMNKATYSDSLKEVVNEFKNDTKDFLVNFKIDDSKEESGGKLGIVFTIKKADAKGQPREYKVAMYIFEAHKSITTFIINGRTLQLLFENSTINSPDIALTYLKEILLNEVKFARELEETIKKQKEESAKKKFEKRRKGSPNRNQKYKNSSKNKGGYKKNNHNGSKYPKNGNGGKQHHSSNRITTKKPEWTNNKTGGSK